MRDSGCHGNRRRGNFVPKSANGHQFSCGEKQSAGCFRSGSTDIRVKNLLACEPPFRSTALRGCSRHGSARTAPSARRLALAEKAPLNGWDLCARWQRRPRIDRDVVGFQNGIAAAVSRSRLLGSTAVLSKIPHCNSSKSVPNRPLWGRRGRFGTLLVQLECGIFGRAAVRRSMSRPDLVDGYPRLFGQTRRRITTLRISV